MSRCRNQLIWNIIKENSPIVLRIVRLLAGGQSSRNRDGRRSKSRTTRRGGEAGHHRASYFAKTLPPPIRDQQSISIGGMRFAALARLGDDGALSRWRSSTSSPSGTAGFLLLPQLAYERRDGCSRWPSFACPMVILMPDLGDGPDTAHGGAHEPDRLRGRGVDIVDAKLVEEIEIGGRAIAAWRIASASNITAA